MKTFNCTITGTCKVNAENEDEAREIASSQNTLYWDWDRVEIEDED